MEHDLEQDGLPEVNAPKHDGHGPLAPKHLGRRLVNSQAADVALDHVDDLRTHEGSTFSDGAIHDAAWRQGFAHGVQLHRGRHGVAAVKLGDVVLGSVPQHGESKQGSGFTRLLDYGHVGISLG